MIEDRSHPRAAAFTRAAAAMLAALNGKQHQGEDAETLARKTWGTGDAATWLTRAATNPATTTDSAWAGALGATVNVDTLMALGPASAGAELLRRGLLVNFDGAGSIRIPTILSAATDTPFVEQGAPLPIRQFVIGGPLLVPKKLATAMAFSRETFEHSVPTIERLTRAALTESVGLSLDTVLLGTGAATNASPAGLRNGISALTASALTPANEAALADVRALVGAVAAVAGNNPIAIIASPTQAASLRLRIAGQLDYPVFASSALASGVVMAVATNAVAAAMDSVPRFDVSTDAAVHMEADSPQQIGTAGSPNVVASPSRSLFQTDCLALRLIMDCNWALRASGAVAWLTTTAW